MVVVVIVVVVVLVVVVVGLIVVLWWNISTVKERYHPTNFMGSHNKSPSL